MSDDLQGAQENAGIQRGNDQRLQQVRPQGPPCPYCGGPIPRIGVELCMHCNHKLAWVDSMPCKPGEEQATRDKIRVATKEREAVRPKQMKDSVVACLIIIGLGLGILFLYVPLGWLVAGFGLVLLLVVWIRVALYG